MCWAFQWTLLQNIETLVVVVVAVVIYISTKSEMRGGISHRPITWNTLYLNKIKDEERNLAPTYW